ncbi:hypothetical protein CDD80_4353 [Ophiocordyceps camponoti-rufipedis]|uniref:Hydrophobin n=1 Tax=Ophiocordyceps camponoti-rufipedis TaxID=2004952 RepID=A0A2C5ZK07_9HYPO|nr:hypothetical protein CDD80_4353 [Ophiocordyceps camponoti-rufipedis]
MARFLVWALAALGSLSSVNAQLLGVGVGIGNTNNNNNGFSNGNGNNGFNNGNNLDPNNRQLRNLLGNTLPRLLPPGACRRGRATVQVTPVKVVRKTPILISAFFPRDTHVPIDHHNTLIVKNAPVHVYTVITRTRYQTTTCARLLRTQQTASCNVNVIGVIGDPNDPGQCTRVNPSPACLSAANLPAACSSLANSNGVALTPLISLCVTALGGLNVGAIASCLVTSLIGTTTTGQSIVTCLTNALGNTCMTALPGTCISLAGLVTISLGGLQACQTSLGPMNSGAAAACFTQNSNGNDLILCLQNALGLVIGRDANGQPCIPNDNIGLGTGGGGLLGGLLGNNGLLGLNLGGLTSGLGGTVGGLTGTVGGLTGGVGGLGGTVGGLTGGLGGTVGGLTGGSVSNPVGLVRNLNVAAPAAADNVAAESVAVPSDSASIATPSASVDPGTSAADSISLPTVTATSISTPAAAPTVAA